MSVVSAINKRAWGLFPYVLLVVFLIGLISQGEALARSKRDEQANKKGEGVRSRVVHILTRDETGRPLKFPSQIFFDHTMEETYVVSGGDKIVVYNSRYFPVASLGKGRGVEGVNGLYVDPTGMVYVCQAGGPNVPPRISVFNAAFFKVRDIYFDSIEGLEVDEFVPKTMVISRDGLFYVVGNARGVLVLNPDGTFSHWLKPVDRLLRPRNESQEGGNQTGTVSPQGAPEGEQGPQNEVMRFLPKSLRPSDTGGGEEAQEEFYTGPVQVTDVEIDSEGHIFVLSEETSKVYIFNAAEEFLYAIGEKGGSRGKMSRPQALAIDENRKAIYITDYMRHTILIYDISGKFMFEFGGYGTGPGWFQYPKGIALDRKGNVIIGDFFNQRVQVIGLKYKAQFMLFRSGPVKK